MASLSEIRAEVARLGVTDPENPSPRDIKLVLDAYLKDKSLEMDAFNTYVKSLSVPLKAMFEGFEQFSRDQGDVSKRTVDIIGQAMDILKGELNRKNLSDDGRREVLDHVLHLAAEARSESERERSFRTRLAQWGAAILAVFVLIGGTVLLVMTLGRYPQVMEKGLELAAMALGKKVLA